MKHGDPTWLALVDCTVHAKPGETAEHATVVMRDGKIVGVMAGEGDGPARLPLGPRLIAAKGLHVYAGFIDGYVEVDAPKPAADAPGRHWHDDVTPQRSALDGQGIDQATAESLRKLGFVAAAISPKGGVFRGSAAVVSLAKPAEEQSAARPPVYRDKVYQMVALDLGNRGYPDSQMGVISLIRQTFFDAQFQFEGRKAGTFGEPVNCLDALLGPGVPTRLVMNAEDELEVLRNAKIAREFSQKVVILGSGSEFKRLPAIVADGLAFMEPLNFPKAPDVSSPGKLESTDLRTLMTWEQAPTNPRRMAKAGIQFALTTAKLKNRDDFAGNLRKAIKHGLTEEQALAALTTTPAALLEVADQLGTVEAGKRADLVVADGPVFGEKTKLRMVIIDGVVHELNAAPVDIEGEWSAEMPGEGTHKLTIDKDNAITVWHNDKSVKATRVSVTPRGVSFAFDAEPVEMGKGVTVMSGALQALESPSTMTGQGMTAAGEAIQWSASRKPKSLEGLWVAKLDNGPAAGVLVIDKDGAISIAREGVKANAPASDVTYDGTTLSFMSDLPAAGSATKASPRWPEARDPEAKPTLKGRAANQDLLATRFAVQGVFKVVEQDGRPVPAADGSAPTISIEKEAVSIKVGDKTAKATEVKIDGPRVSYSYNTNDLSALEQDAKEPKDADNAKEPESPKDDQSKKEGEKDAKAAKPAIIWKDELFVTLEELTGTSTLPDGSTHTFKATRQPSVEDGAKKAEEDRIKTIPEALPTPFGAYGIETYPAQGTYLISNATVWTSGAAGNLTKASVLVRSGTIAWVGAGVPPAVPAGAITIDAGGKHVTPSIIDCHSHTGISRGVNEGGQAITSEVRIADVTNPDAMAWYWELAGGVSCVNSLHGSANAIGGQSQTNKLRWGVAHPDDMHLEGAKASIKFALGENPRQVNGGGSDRYPQTRMGVETLIRDRFTAAREYGAARKGKNPPRRDLELDALAEVLDGSRIIHCHSYRQDEIVMLCEVAKDFHFKIGTFQHILEGYKVADYVRDYSGGASAFSDWWAYKVEVQDAIPQGPPLMHDVGVVVTYNSDSDELARRMNVEAAKAVKYGNLPEAEALKFVTINAAKQMQIDNRTGSLEVGKDADIAIWNGSPLSTLSKCELTMVDGRVMWSLETDAKLRERNKADRERIVQKLLADDAAKKPEGAGPAGPARRRRPTEAGLTDDDLRTLERAYQDLQRSGKTLNQPGVCGCGLIHEQ